MEVRKATVNIPDMPGKTKRSRYSDNAEQITDDSSSSDSTSSVESEESEITLSAAGAIMARTQVVLDKIAKHMQCDALFDLRLTCATWNRTFLPPLKRSLKCLLLQETSSTQFTREYIDLVRSSQDFPMTRCRVALTVCTQNPDLLLVCGPSIKSLHLDGKKELQIGNGGMDVSLLRRIFFVHAHNLNEITLSLDFAPGLTTNLIPADTQEESKSPALPNLKKLELWCTGTITPSFHNFLMEVIRRAVNLEDLSIQENYGDPRNTSVAHHNLNMLSILRDTSQQLGNLRILNMPNLGANELQILIQLCKREVNQLHLNSLETRISCKKDEVDQSIADFLNTFLTLQAPTLRIFKLDVGVSDQVISGRMIAFRLPCMERLHTLALTGCCVWELPVYFEKSTLSQTFSCLRSFEFSLVNLWDPGTAHSQSDLKRLEHPAVTEIILTDARLGGPLSPLSEFGVMYPSVRQFKASFYMSNERNLNVLWSTWPDLETLDIVHAETEPGSDVWDLDEFFSGITNPRTQFSYFSRNGADEISVSQLREACGALKTSPGISDLHQLRRFTLDPSLVSSYTMSNFGGYLGLAMASPTLQLVKIRSTWRFNLLGIRTSILSKKCCSLILSVLGPAARIEM